MDYLKEIGIERWRLRQPLVEAEPIAKEITGQVEQTAVKNIVQDLNSDVEPVESIASEISAPETEIYKPEDSWSQLLADFESQTSCECCQNNGSILGEGKLDASLVVIVDGPSREDIQAQQLVSGRAGKLLDAILFSIGFDRETIYLSSVFKCPAGEPGDPASTCNSWVRRQLDLIKPEAVLLTGDFAAQSILQTNDELAVLRNSVHQKAKSPSEFVVTHTVQSLLQAPHLKSEVWADMQKLSASLTHQQH